MDNTLDYQSRDRKIDSLLLRSFVWDFKLRSCFCMTSWWWDLKPEVTRSLCFWIILGIEKSTLYSRTSMARTPFGTMKICSRQCWLVVLGLAALWDSISVYIGRLPERGRERIEESKNVQTFPTRTYCKRNRPLPYYHPNCRTPQHWKFTQDHHTTWPPLWDRGSSS